MHQRPIAPGKLADAGELAGAQRPGYVTHTGVAYQTQRVAWMESDR